MTFFPQYFLPVGYILDIGRENIGGAAFMNPYHGLDRFKKLLLCDKYGGDKALLNPEDLRRFKKGEPVDYIIGWTPFLDADIDLSQHPLIPRPETEYWVKHALEEIEAARSSRGAVFRALDIFAGSGCIGVAILKHFPGARVDFADIDFAMIEQIAINVKKNSVVSRARLICSNGFENTKGKYNYIFANPPYVSGAEMKKLPRAVKDFEPHRALYGRKDGLYFIKKFLREARIFLKQKGVFYMEFSPPQKMKIEKLLKKTEWREIKFLKDQYGRWRVLRGRK